MEPRLPPQTALILIDVQEGFDHPSWGRRNNPMAENNIALLLAAWRDTAQPVFHVRHLSLSPLSVLKKDHPGCRIKQMAAPLPNEPVISKNVNSAFIGTALEQALRARGLRSLLFVGFTTDHCVSTSVRMAANLGFDVYGAGDAMVTFERRGTRGECYPAEVIHDVALASLNREFATILSTEEILAPARRKLCEI